MSHHSRIDILINFNWLDLNRWILPDVTKYGTLDGLYGGQRWRQALQLEGDDRKEFLIREYGLALLEAGWRSTNFEMINNHNQTQYYLFFATRSSKGMEVIKKRYAEGVPRRAVSVCRPHRSQSVTIYGDWDGTGIRPRIGESPDQRL